MLSFCPRLRARSLHPCACAAPDARATLGREAGSAGPGASGLDGEATQTDGAEMTWRRAGARGPAARRPPGAAAPRPSPLPPRPGPPPRPLGSLA